MTMGFETVAHPHIMVLQSMEQGLSGSPTGKGR
jgi:hypothetical protein